MTHRGPRPVPEGMTTLGMRVKKKRERMGISITQLAKELDIDRRTIWAWETERSQGPGPKATAKIVSWLLGDLDVPESEWRERALAAEYTLAVMGRHYLRYLRGRKNAESVNEVDAGR